MLPNEYFISLIEPTLSVIRENGLTTEPLDNLATRTIIGTTNPESMSGMATTRTNGTIEDRTLNIVGQANISTSTPMQYLEVKIDSDVAPITNSLEITFGTQLLRLGRPIDDRTWQPGLLTTRIKWQELLPHQDEKIQKGLEILAHLAELDIKKEELQQDDTVSYANPHSRIFNAASYILLANRIIHNPNDYVRYVPTQFQRDEDNHIEISQDQADLAIHALRSILDTGIEQHSEKLGNKIDPATGRPIFFAGFTSDTRTSLMQAVIGTPLAELAKKNVYGYHAGNPRDDARQRENFVANPPMTIFDIVHEDQRENTDSFFKSLNDDGTNNYQEQARYLEAITTELRGQHISPEAEMNRLYEQRNIDGLLDLRDGLSLFFLDKLYPHLDIYNRCEYIDILNPAMRRTIDAYCTDNGTSSDAIYNDIIGLQNNLLSVVVDEHGFEPIVRPDLDPNGTLTALDFTKGQMHFQAGSIDPLGIRNVENFVRIINAINERIVRLRPNVIE
jgi:hypothetical protein